MSFEAMRRPSSGFLTLVLSRSMPKRRSLRTLMTSSAQAVEAGFLKLSTETTRVVSSISPRLRYLLGVVKRIGDVAVKRYFALFCVIVAVSRRGRWDQS